MQRTFSDLTKYIKRAPPLSTSFSVLLIIFLIEFFRTFNLTKAFLLIILTGAITLFIDHILSKKFKSNLNLKKNAFLLAISMVIFYLVFVIFQVAFPFLVTQNIAISLSFTSYFRFLVFYTYLSDDDSVNYVSALAFTLSFTPFYVFYSDYTVLVETIIYGLISTYLAYLMIIKSTEKFKSKYKEEPRNLIKFFLYSSTNPNYAHFGNRFFSKIYSEKRSVPVNFIRILNPKGTEKCTFVFPYIHPGPFGTVGTSNLPVRLQEKMSGIGGDLLVFHTSTTNNNNCSGDIDIENIAEGIKSNWGGNSRSNTMSFFTHEEKDGIIIDGMVYGDFGFVALNPGERKFDDIEITQGLELMKNMKSKGIMLDVLDGQNNFQHAGDAITDLSPFRSTIEDVFTKITPTHPAKMGYFRAQINSNAIGPMGGQACVFRIDDRMFGILLTDSNNITGDLMKAIRKKVSEKLDYLAIYTTDNHIVNQSGLDMNPLGEKDDIMELAGKFEGILNNAIDDLEDVEFIHGSADVNVNMGSENSYNELMDMVFHSIKRAKYIAFTTVSLTFVIPFILSITGIIFKIPFIR